MLPSSSWGKRKPRSRRLGWVRSDARGGVMWARQEGLRHPHPHAVVRCPSSSSSVSCSGKGPPPSPCSLAGCPLLLPSLPARSTHFLPPQLPQGVRATSSGGAVSRYPSPSPGTGPGALCVASLSPEAWIAVPLGLSEFGFHPLVPKFLVRLQLNFSFLVSLHF